ncbi:uncharacterized protein B0H18DRAFT_419506 [Fomitopsis serialis]|uniref:uncharacterized protein n=1 Tax=Fomitopsis serialis TaxID=139415 RepID=UPI0020078D6D|nr:uncharacterized protein B0H18DRAFT_419506 [Neoantrodia serialis]KAH9935648.1 hypothetical protein B0H18DRAFT_419506 [Neoantrodia serialis]
MKRGAERQLTRDDADRDEDDRDEGDKPERGLQKADATALVGRPMRGLPKGGRWLPPLVLQHRLPLRQRPLHQQRLQQDSPVLSVSAPYPRLAPHYILRNRATEARRLLRVRGEDIKSILHGCDHHASNTCRRLILRIFISVWIVNFTTTSAASSSNRPAVASSASQATKSFASFLGSGGMNGTASGKTEKADSDDDRRLKEEVEYLSNIRGLNMSLLSTVKSTIESDPFADVGSILEAYKSLRLEEKMKFDEKIGGLKGSTDKVAGNKSSTITNAFAPPPSMPKPSGSFTNFGQSKSAGKSSEDEGKNGSASVSSAPGSSVFEFGKSSSSSSAPSAPAFSSQPFVFGGGAPAPSSSASSKGAGFSALGKGRPSEDKSGDAPASNASSFSFASTTSANPFGKPADKGDTDKEENKSAFASSISGSSSSGGLFGGPTPSSSGSTLFGGSSAPTAFSTPTSFTTPEKPTSSGFSFGATSPNFTVGASSSPSKGSSFGAFGKSAALGSIGNPVGFGFGSPPKESEDSASSSSSIAPKPFVFGPPKDKSAEESKADGAAGSESKDQGAAGDEPPPTLITGSIHDKEGEGEEDETTTHEIKSKVYKMVKDEDGLNRWADQGVGMLRLKKHKETDARRMLLRNSSTGKVVVNFRIYSGMNAKADKNVVSFVGHESGAQATYRIRTKTEEQANDLKSALDREIEFVRAKSPSL